MKIAAIGVDVYIHKSDFTDHHGLVDGLQIAPGSYYLAPMIANPYVSSVSVPTFHFDVRAGETTYLGELFMKESCGLSNYFEINDRFDRDIALARTRNPNLLKRTSENRLMRLGEPISR